MQDACYLILMQAVSHFERKLYILVWAQPYFPFCFKPCSTSYLSVRGWGTCCWLQD